MVGFPSSNQGKSDSLSWVHDGTSGHDSTDLASDAIALVNDRATRAKRPN